MEEAATDRSPFAEERLETEWSNLDNDYVLGPTGSTEEADCASYISERPGFPFRWSAPFSVADVKQMLRPKRTWSWLTSVATGRRRFTALARVPPSTPAAPSSRVSRPPFMGLHSTKSLSGNGDGSCSISNDGRRLFSNQLFSASSAACTSSGSANRQPKTSRRKTHILSAEPWLIGGEGEMPLDASEAGSNEEEKERQEEVVEMTAVNSGVGLWASRGVLAGVAMLYGTNFGCVKLLEETIPTSLAAALRFTVALVPFLPFLMKTSIGVFRTGVEIGLFDAVGFWTQSKSLATTTASKAAFICSLAVIFVPIIDAVFGAANTKGAKAAKATDAADKKHQGAVFAIFNGPWFPALLAVVGVACLELIGSNTRPNTGDVWALGQPLCFGVGFWLTEQSGRSYAGDTFGIVAAHLLTLAVLAISWCALAGQMPASFESLHDTIIPPSGSLTVGWSLLWTGLVTTSLPVFLETLAMKRVSAAESTVILSAEPIWGTLFAAVLLGETVGWNTGIGAALIILACTWSSVGSTIQSNVLFLIASAKVRETSAGRGIVDVDYLNDTVGTSGRQQSVELV